MPHISWMTHLCQSTQLVCVFAEDVTQDGTCIRKRPTNYHERVIRLVRHVRRQIRAHLRTSIMSLCGSHPPWLNMNETEDKSVEAENWPWTKIVLTVLFCLLIVITIIGNTLVILSVITTRRLRTVTNLFVMSLAVADWLVGIFVMPPAVLVSSVGEYLILASVLEENCNIDRPKPSRTRFLSVYSGSWPLGWVFCEIWISLDVLLCTASILSLCAISIDRWVCRNGNVIHYGANLEGFLWLILPLNRHCCQRELIKRYKPLLSLESCTGFQGKGGKGVS